MGGQPAYSTCTRGAYGDLGEGVVSVHNSEVKPNGKFQEGCGTAYQSDPINNPGELVVGFPTGKMVFMIVKKHLLPTMLIVFS